MTKKKRREPDVVARFHEDAKWSSYTNSVIRWPVTGGFGTHRAKRSALIIIGLIVVGILTGTILFMAILGSLR